MAGFPPRLRIREKNVFKELILETANIWKHLSSSEEKSVSHCLRCFVCWFVPLFTKGGRKYNNIMFRAVQLVFPFSDDVIRKSGKTNWSVCGAVETRAFSFPLQLIFSQGPLEK
jgi:hypothetical protein